MDKNYGEIEISEGFIVGNYYKCCRKYDNNVNEVELKYLGEKEGWHKFLDEDLLEIVEFTGSGVESCDHNFGTYTILSNKNVLTWKISNINYNNNHFTLELSKDGRKVSSTVNLDYSIRELAKSLGVKL